MTTEALIILTMAGCVCGFVFPLRSIARSHKLKSVNLVPSIIHYKVVESGYRKSLESEVKNLLNDGWVCVGGISCMTVKTGEREYRYEYRTEWTQAMQREVKI